MRHPATKEMVERKIEVHRDKPLKDATMEAYKVSDASTPRLYRVGVACKEWVCLAGAGACQIERSS